MVSVFLDIGIALVFGAGLLGFSPAMGAFLGGVSLASTPYTVEMTSRIELRFLTELDALRQQRHELMYGLEVKEVSHTIVREAVRTAEEFIATIRKLLEEKGDNSAHKNIF